MGHHEGHFGHVVTQEIFNFWNIANAGHHEKALPPAIVFAQQRFAQSHRVKFTDIGADGQPVHGRRADDRQIPHTRQRQLQRARNRRGGQRQHVDVGPQFLQAFFVAHPEALFFIDDQQTQIVKAHRFGQHRMGAHNDVHSSTRQTVAGFFRLGRAHKARKGADFQGKAPEPFFERLGMLAGQQGRGGDDRHLKPRHGRHKRRAHGHFCFAKSHVATNQAVHGATGVQVFHHGFDGRQLVVCFLVRKAGVERFPHAQGRVDDGGFAQCPFRSHAHQPVGHFLDAFFQTRLFGLPRTPAQLVQQTFIVAVSRQQFDVFHRQIQLGVFGVFQQQAFMGRTGGCDDVHALVPANPVVHVHHQIPQRQALAFGQEVFRAFAFLRRAHQAVTQNVLFGYHAKITRLEPVVQGPNRHIETCTANVLGRCDGDGSRQTFVRQKR